jgi:YfiH family protein
MHTYTSKNITIYFGKQAYSIPFDQINTKNQGSEISRFIRTLLPSPFTEKPFFFTDQVHGVQGIEVTPQTVKSIPPFMHEADFMITAYRDVALGVVTADCVPLVLYDPTKPALAIVHAGWRGSVAGILKNTVRKMTEIYVSDPHELQLIIGPAARGCCYEIGPEVLQIIRTFTWADQVLQQRNNRWYADMIMFNVCLAQNLGIKAHLINIDGICCTICNPQYCSYRRQGASANRQISIALLT